MSAWHGRPACRRVTFMAFALRRRGSVTRALAQTPRYISKAQHCRSEVYLAGFGWVPVDAADVRKVVLEEPPTNLAIDDPKVVAARKTLFGSWESNWLAYNFAHDVALPGSSGPKLAFLMYPQGEIAERAARLSRSRQFQIHHHREGADRSLTSRFSCDVAA